MNEEIKKLIAQVLKQDNDYVEKLISQKDNHLFDSLQLLNFVIELETKFNIALEPEEIEKMITFDDIISVINNKKII